MRRRNFLPGAAHNVNKVKLANKGNCSWRLVQCCLVDQASRKSMISARRVGSMQSSWETVSSSMPRSTRFVVGETV